MKRIDLTGKKFNCLQVINYHHTQKPRGESYYSCLCDCGQTTIVSAGHLKNGHTKSCGCLQIKTVTERSMNNTWGRKYDDPKEVSAKFVWEGNYDDGGSFETFMRLSQEECYYCGISANQSNCFNKYINQDNQLTNTDVSFEWANQAYFRYNGLDRIDPTKDHSEDNIVPSCFPCNRAKDDRTMKEFVEWLTRISNHFLRKIDKNNHNYLLIICVMLLVRIINALETKEKAQTEICA